MGMVDERLTNLVWFSEAVMSAEWFKCSSKLGSVICWAMIEGGKVVIKK